MRSTPARRELGFVFAVAVAGLALVLVVVFAPWYPGLDTVGPPGQVADVPVVVVNRPNGGAALTP